MLDLLDVQKIINNKISMRWQRIRMGDVVAMAIEASQPNLQKRCQLFSVELPDTPVFVMGDPLRLCQVFTNLINNAAKFSADGAYIEIQVGTAGREVLVTVRDQGIGIDSEELPRIFEFFVQVGDAHLHSGGMGLGLALSKGLVELHGGSIEARSAGKGRGSELIVHLPEA